MVARLVRRHRHAHGACLAGGYSQRREEVPPEEPAVEPATRLNVGYGEFVPGAGAEDPYIADFHLARVGNVQLYRQLLANAQQARAELAVEVGDGAGRGCRGGLARRRRRANG